MSLQQQYQQRETEFAAIAAQLRSQYNRYSIIRLVVFLVAIGLIIYFWSLSKLLALGAVVTFLVAFGAFMRWHQAIQRRAIHFEHLATINQQEQQALAGDSSAFEDGAQFVDPQHPYAVDLDLFGPYSLFQYSNRSSTSIGAQRLADYLGTDATAAVLDQPGREQEIMARQASIAELSEMLDWRQHFRAYGMVADDELQHVQSLKNWLQREPVIYNARWLHPLLWIAPPLVMAGFAYVFAYYPWPFLIVPLAFPLYILRKYLDHVNQVNLETNKVDKILAYYAKLIEHAEQQDFASAKLQALRNQFTEAAVGASEAIRKLSYRIKQLNVRNNAFVIIINIFGLWDLHWTLALEKWKVANKEQLPRWFDTLAELEALSSLATVRYNNPDWSFPVIQEQSQLKGVELGHPLLLREQRVNNSVQMPTDGHIKLVTGSNMAGKSTLLRTVGINIVLAMIGAPVCAQELRLPFLKVYTSMRTQDALHENTSSFYAELKRLKFIIDAVENGDNIFFLLDEILKGTNSRDRHSGARALIKQLIAHRGSGFVATHDLELGNMEAGAGGSVENLCMEVEVKDGKLVFDYKIKKGVSQSFNATHLMREMGIRV
ncbi:MAG: hypothetical protein AAFO94_00645 [Bacteroidota bacterium]